MRLGGLVLAAMLGGCLSISVSKSDLSPSTDAMATGEPMPTGPVRSLDEIYAASPESDWRTLDQHNLLYLDLKAGGRVVIELAPDFAPNVIANIRSLAHERYFDDSAVMRVQDNYVVQWGRPESSPKPLGSAQATIPAEFDRAITPDLDFTAMQDPDSYTPQTGFTRGMPVARGPIESGEMRTWPIHCYGMVGVGRGDTPESGNGSELYVVIGQAPRHLDRNVVLVGRVVKGIEHLSSLPRGTGPLGFYESEDQYSPIASIRLGSDVPAGEQENLEALRTDSATFRDVIEARRWRREDWFLAKTGHINVCNVPLPVRARQ